MVELRYTITQAETKALEIREIDVHICNTETKLTIFVE